jgi:hypothetical protein
MPYQACRTDFVIRIHSEDRLPHSDPDISLSNPIGCTTFPSDKAKECREGGDKHNTIKYKGLNICVLSTP